MYYEFWRRGNKEHFLNQMMKKAKEMIKIKPSKPPEYYAPNHPHECARRRRQIEKGMLKVTP